MRRGLIVSAAHTAIALWSCVVLTSAATGDAVSQQIDAAPCVAAAATRDDDAMIAACAALIESEKTTAPERIKALVARGGAYDRKDQTERALADYDMALRLDPKQADVLNARGELRRRKGDLPRALADFGAALKLDPQHEAARASYKSLALELERIGAQMAVKNKPIAPLK